MVSSRSLMNGFWLVHFTLYPFTTHWFYSDLNTIFPIFVRGFRGKKVLVTKIYSEILIFIRVKA